MSIIIIIDHTFHIEFAYINFACFAYGGLLFLLLAVAA